MAPIASLVVLAALSQTPSAESGDALILESIRTSTAVDRRDLADVEVFLAERIRESWGVEVSNTPPITEGGRHFFVTLMWRTPELVLLRVAERDATHVEREVVVADPTSGRAILWLAIRSSIERALAAMPPAPTVEEMLDDMAEGTKAREEIAAANAEADAAPEPPAPPEPPATPSSPAGPPPTPTTVTPTATGDVMDPRLYENFATMWANRSPPSPGAITAAVLARGTVDGGLGFGPAAQLQYTFNRWLTVGGELAYYSIDRAFRTSPTATLDVHIAHVPLTAMASMQPLLEVPLELGARATLDLQLVTADSTSAGVRVLTGPFARSSLPFYVGDSDGASFIAEIKADFAVVRGAYNFGNQRFVDPFVSVGAAVGVEYRWR